MNAQRGYNPRFMKVIHLLPFIWIHGGQKAKSVLSKEEMNMICLKLSREGYPRFSADNGHTVEVDTPKGKFRVHRFADKSGVIRRELSEEEELHIYRQEQRDMLSSRYIPQLEAAISIGDIERVQYLQGVISRGVAQSV